VDLFVSEIEADMPDSDFTKQKNAWWPSAAEARFISVQMNRKEK
jgi:hypothetical protein